jgi:perosamine synthetase
MKLALFGGVPIRTKPYPAHRTTDNKDLDIAIQVMKEGILSDFEGSNNEWHLGGKYVKQAEAKWASYFDVKHVISVNSATSGLFAAVGAAGVGPGDEVITSPWTMTATASAIVVNNAVPIFADIDPETFCLMPEAIEKKITKRTKAIIVVHIYGHPADMDAIMALARKYNLVVIEDAAQSLGATYAGKQTGTLGHMGVHSLNGHKLIQTGEGGMIFTDDDEYAHRLQLIRNHAEAVVATGFPVKSLVNMIGWNYRMNEIEAAMSMTQLEKLAPLQHQRNQLERRLTAGISEFKGLITPEKRESCDHTYYRYALRVDQNILPVNAHSIVEALNAEGLDWYAGYTPLNLFPLYQQQIAFGDKGCPFKCPLYDGKPDYTLDSLPNVRHHMKYSFSTENVRPPLSELDMDMMIEGFAKVYKHMDQLADHEKAKEPC